MNEQTVKGKWREIKGEIQKIWGDITGDDLDKAQGNMNSVAGMIQKKYGQSQDEISKKLNEIVGRYDTESTPTSNDMNRNDSLNRH